MSIRTLAYTAHQQGIIFGEGGNQPDDLLFRTKPAKGEKLADSFRQVLLLGRLKLSPRNRLAKSCPGTGSGKRHCKISLFSCHLPLYLVL
jgi:hypothetical protein